MPRKKDGRGAQGAGSIRKRSDGRWEARYTLGRDPGTGKQVRRSVYGATQGEVRKRLTATLAEIDDGVYTEPEKMKAGQWFNIWLDQFCGAVKPRTRELYRASVDYRIRPALGAVVLQQLNTAMIQKFYNEALEGKNRKKALAPKTLRNIHGILHKALQQAVEAGYIHSNPADACKLPNAIRPEIHPLDEKQTRAFFDAVRGDPFERIFNMDVFTGLREGEIVGLPWDGVDFDAGTIRIYQQLQMIKGVYRIGPPKNSKPRTITPAPFVMNLLREQRKQQNEWKLLAGPAWEESGFVFTNELGQHLATRTLYRHFKVAVNSIGLPDARFHDLRHTYAVASIRAGDDVKTVSENLGHASVAFTLDVYGHVTEQMKKDSAQRMQAYIDGLSTAQK